MTLRVAFVVAHDAYLKGARNIAAALQADVSTCWLTTSPLLVNEQTRLLDLDTGQGLELLGGCDQVIAGLGGRNLNRLIRALRMDRGTGLLPEIIGFFPGVLHLRILESLATRLLCDRVLLNSPRDYALYQKLSLATLGYNNGVLLGAPWIKATPFGGVEKPSLDIDLLFIEQSIVPGSLSERTELVRKLYQLAVQAPEKKIVVALRARKDQASSHQPEHCLEELFFQQYRTGVEFSEPKLHGPLANLRFVIDDVDCLLPRARALATVSSSVAFTSLACGQATLFINDFGIHRSYGNDLFVRSGCMGPLALINADQRDHHWVAHYVMAMDSGMVARLLAEPGIGGADIIAGRTGCGVPGIHLHNPLLLKLILHYLSSRGFRCWREISQLLSSIRNINRHIYGSEC